MTSTDIQIKRLDVVSNDDAQYLLSLIRSIPGFPKDGILFRDFMPVLADGKGLRIMLDALTRALPVSVDDFDVVAGLEARGFLFGPALAAQLGKGFVAVRKAGKLPPPTVSEQYTLEYGEACIEVERDVVHEGQRVLIVDDLIATGGTVEAAAKLINKCGGVVVGCSFVMELIGLNGLSKIGDIPTSSLVSMPA